MYVPFGLAFFSIRGWRLFTPEQCAGINKFVGDFAFPFLVLDVLVNNDPYTMSFHVLGADALQKLVVLAALLLWKSLSKKCSFEWVITLFALLTLPNLLVFGHPLIQSMYGISSSTILVQIVVVQIVIWLNVLQAMYEFRAARILIAERFPNTAGSIASFRVHPDVVSLCDSEQLETDAEIGANRTLHVVVRSSCASVSSRISTESFKSAESGKMEGSSKSCGTPERNYLRSNSSRAGHAAFDLEAIEPSPQNETDSKSSAKDLDEEDEGKEENPPAGVVTRLILIAMWRKLIRNPINYASVVGLAWSLIAFRYNIKLPLFIKGSITLISETGVGLAMFGLGLSIGLQPKIMACKISTVITCTALNLLVGPAVMAATSAAVGLHGIVFQTSTVQAVLPVSTICFVFAKQYNVHLEIFSSSIITTTILFLPVTIVCNLLLRLLSW